MKHDYTALDGAIKEALATGPKKFRELENAPEIKRQAIKLAAAHNANVKYLRDQKPAWRFVDTRLQAIRKKGEIKFCRNAVGWSLKGEA